MHTGQLSYRTSSTGGYNNFARYKNIVLIGIALFLLLINYATHEATVRMLHKDAIEFGMGIRRQHTASKSLRRRGLPILHELLPNQTAVNLIAKAYPALHSIQFATPSSLPPNVSEYMYLPEEQRLIMEKRRITEHVQSRTFETRQRDMQFLPDRGILINAGGARYTINLIVTLKILREQLGCMLPVHVWWQGPDEMDSLTWSSITSLFAPITGGDITSVQHPVMALRWNAPTKHFMGKVFGLLNAPFKELLMLDADCMPLQPPEAFFEHPQYRDYGALFWPDAWTDSAQDDAYTLFGINRVAVKKYLHVGMGFGRRDMESGQIVLNRTRHLDALEYLVWLNAHELDLEGSLWGDKDTFPLAWALAGKPHLFAQVAVPPAGIFHWALDKLRTKETREVGAGWQLLGFLQHDSWGRPAFLHRTINKFRADEEPWQLELISGPMPARWVSYYLAHETQGPTEAVPWDFVAPASAFTVLAPNPPVHWRQSNGTAWHDVPARVDCPAAFFTAYLEMRLAGLPLDRDMTLEEVCASLLSSVLGDLDHLEDFKLSDLLDAPTLSHLKGDVLEAEGEMKGVPDGTPIAAWRPDFESMEADGPFAILVRAAYAAYHFAIKNASMFPKILDLEKPKASPAWSYAN